MCIIQHMNMKKREFQGAYSIFLLFRCFLFSGRVELHESGIWNRLQF